MAGPASYAIRVRGRIEPNDVRRLRGMSIVNPEPGESVTELRGELPDQAALFGVLGVLHEYQLPLVSVTCLESGTDGRKEK